MASHHFLCSLMMLLCSAHSKPPINLPEPGKPQQPELRGLKQPSKHLRSKDLGEELKLLYFGTGINV